MTFEHVPPRSAYNRRRISVVGLDSLIEGDQASGVLPRKSYVQQRGSGFYTLCDFCNNQAGRLYVPEFRQWVRQGADILFGPRDYAKKGADLTRRAYVRVTLLNHKPGLFMKQMVTMLLAMSPPSLGDVHPELRTYAHEPDRTGLPPELRFYLALFAGPNGRYAGGAKLFRNIGTDKPIEDHHVFEFARPPFSYVLSINEKTPVVEAGNISNFTCVGIHQTANVQMDLILGYGPTMLPMDYRSPAAFAAEVGANETAMRARGEPTS